MLLWQPYTSNTVGTPNMETIGEAQVFQAMTVPPNLVFISLPPTVYLLRNV